MSALLAPAAPAVRPLRVATALLLAVLSLVASVLLAPPASAETSTEGEFIAKLNAERSARGLPALRVTQDLTENARAQSDRMAASDSIFHNPNLTTDVAGWLRVSENVGYGPDASSIHTALMNSTGHRTNMLDTVVTQVGIGTTWKGSRLYVTQVFRRPDSTTVNAPGIGAPAPAAAPAPPPPPPAAAPAPPPPPPAAAPAPPPPPAAPVDLGLAACPSGLPTARFADVPTGSAAAAHVDCAAWWELVKGVSNGVFAPSVAVNRAQVASLVARQLQVAGRLPVATRDHFRDDESTPHEASINALAEEGILAGTSPGVFSPYGRLSRAQLAAVLVRVQEHLLGRALPVGTVPFADVDGNVHVESIAKAYAAGLTTGTTPTLYGPGGQVTRQNMAAFLVRAIDKLIAANVVARP